MTEGPCKRTSCLNLDEVDSRRKLDCRRYDSCLNQVIRERWPSWECPGDCCSYAAAPELLEVAAPAQRWICRHPMNVVGVA